MIKKSILIIDDDIILLKTAEEILSDLYSVSVAKGGKQGIALLKKGIIPNLILLDIAMPEMDGYQATKLIRQFADKEKANIPIIAMTANAFSEDIRHSLTAGMNAHISKPVDMKTLEKTIRSIRFDGNMD